MRATDARRDGPTEDRERLRGLAQDVVDALRRWVGVPVEVDTGERSPMRQRVPA